jgi:hypothetical protein
MEVRELNKKAKEHAYLLLREMSLSKRCGRKTIKMRYRHVRIPRCSRRMARVCYRKYPGEPIQMIKMIHGEICDLPYGNRQAFEQHQEKGPTLLTWNCLPMDKKAPRSYETVSRVRFTPTNVL